MLARPGHTLVGACTSPTQYDQATPLDEGSYTFRTGSRDEAGNTATATRTFSVDLTPPTVTLGQAAQPARPTTPSPASAGRRPA